MGGIKRGRAGRLRKKKGKRPPGEKTQGSRKLQEDREKLSEELRARVVARQLSRSR